VLYKIGVGVVAKWDVLSLLTVYLRVVRDNKGNFQLECVIRSRQLSVVCVESRSMIWCSSQIMLLLCPMASRWVVNHNEKQGVLSFLLIGMTLNVWYGQMAKPSRC
jgi:hypothetical protein